MTQDLFQRLYCDVIDKARENHIARSEVCRVFMDAYETHKAKHGSFKHVLNYHERMSERYHFMHDTAIKYIETHRETLGVGSKL